MRHRVTALAVVLVVLLLALAAGLWAVGEGALGMFLAGVAAVVGARGRG